jgi:hypothetical protein
MNCAFFSRDLRKIRHRHNRRFQDSKCPDPKTRRRHGAFNLLRNAHL